MKTIVISGVIGFDVSPNEIRRQLSDAKGEDVIIEISSPGGFVFDGLEIFNLIKNYQGKTTTKLMGLAASMASYIALAGDKAVAEKNAIFMIHNVSSFIVGDHEDLRKAADVAEGMSDLLAAEYAAKSGKTIEEIRKLMDAETFLFGDEIKEAGFVDEIIKGKSKSETKNQAVVKAVALIKECNGILKDLDENKNDIEKAVALFGQNVPQNNKIKKEGSPMADSALTKFLKENPEAKAEHEKALAEAKKVEKKPEAKAPENTNEIKKQPIAYAKGFLNNKTYPTLGALAADVISGDVDVSALMASVAAIDHSIEAKKSADAQDEQSSQGETLSSELDSKELAIEKQIENNLLSEIGAK